MKSKDIIAALRCTSTPGGPTGNCEKCPYWKKEQLSGKLKERLGTDEWTGCDVDKIGLDAADLIERLRAENAALREGASLGKLKRSQKQAYEKSIKFLRALADGQASEIKKLQADLDWKTLFAESALDAQERAEKAEVERDALLEQIKARRSCLNCKHFDYCEFDNATVIDCMNCVTKNCPCYQCGNSSRWEWRGLPEAPEEGKKV